MTPAYGRGHEVAVLTRACAAAAAGAGRLVLLTGEAGIGKSLLADLAAAAAADAGLQVVRGWCADDAGAPPLWPWRRAARRQPRLAAALEAGAGPDPDDLRSWRVTEAVADALCEPDAVPTCVVLEDLHWADPASLDLLRRLLPEIARAPVLLVGTGRDVGLGASPFAGALAGLLRSPATMHLPLRGLDEEAVASWVAADPATARWSSYAADLVAQTGGNPFYLRTLLDEVPQPVPDASVALADRPHWRSVLLAPYRPLPARARRTLAYAAVMGERLAPALLADALGRPVAEVSDDLAAGVAAGLLHFGTAGLAFEHALVRDAVRADLGPAEREDADAGVAAALERTGDPDLVGPAAVHWSRVDGARAAGRCRDLASRAATDQGQDPERAVGLARLALTSARALGAPAAELAEHLLLVARLEWAAGMLGEALASCASGLDLAETGGRPDLMADFALVPQGVGSVDLAPVVGARCRRALAALPAEEGVRRTRLLALSAVVAAEGAQPAARLGATSPRPAGTAPAPETPDQLSARALAGARATGDEQAELEAVAARHFVLSHPLAITERTRLAERAVELAPRAATTMGALWGHLWRADLAFQRGDVLAVEEAVVEVERCALRRASPVARWHALRLRSAVCVLTGRLDRARSTAREARTLADRVGDLSMIGMHHAFHVNLAVLRGDPGDVLPDSLELLARVPPMPLVSVSVPLILALHGDLDQARGAFAPLRGVPRQMPLGPRWLGTVGQIGLAAVAVGDAEVARTCHRLLLPTAGWCGADGGGSPFASGSNEHALGRLAQCSGDLRLAAGHFRRGLAVDDRIGARPYAATGRLGLAECLAPDDPEESLALARAAAAELARLDMPGPLASARSLVEVLERRGSRTTGPATLSPREAEVARLVARALTNAEIAEELVLSVRTVESHVASILTKLGLTSRTQVAVRLHDSAR